MVTSWKGMCSRALRGSWPMVREELGGKVTAFEDDVDL